MIYTNDYRLASREHFLIVHILDWLLFPCTEIEGVRKNIFLKKILEYIRFYLKKNIENNE